MPVTAEDAENAEAIRFKTKGSTSEFSATSVVHAVPETVKPRRTPRTPRRRVLRLRL